MLGQKCLRELPRTGPDLENPARLSFLRIAREPRDARGDRGVGEKILAQALLGPVSELFEQSARVHYPHSLRSEEGNLVKPEDLDRAPSERHRIAY